MTIKQYFPRADKREYLDQYSLDSAELWDAMRQDHPNFALPNTREAWGEMCEKESHKDGLDGRLPQRADSILALMNQKGFTEIVSVGVGSAGLEYHLKKLRPNLHVSISEFAPGNVATLRRVFTECDSIREFNILAGDWKDLNLGPSSLVLINRLDPLFTNDQWRDVFRRAALADVSNLLFIPAWTLTLRPLLGALKRHWRCRLSGVPLNFTGWSRTRRVLCSFWSNHYRAEVFPLAGLTGYLLSHTS